MVLSLQYGLLYCMKENKILLFEYLVYHLIKWYKDVTSNKRHDINRHFSRLTALKLLFFVSTIKDTENEDKDLLDIFNNYCAMQYGPVEIDIYTAIVKEETKFYRFGVHELTIMDQEEKLDTLLNENDKNKIDRAIFLLKKRNSKIISYPVSKLIDISHKWDAWQNAMFIASMFGKRCENMPKEAIRENYQFYE